MENRDVDRDLVDSVAREKARLLSNLSALVNLLWGLVFIIGVWMVFENIWQVKDLVGGFR